MRRRSDAPPGPPPGPTAGRPADKLLAAATAALPWVSGPEADELAAAVEAAGGDPWEPFDRVEIRLAQGGRRAS